MHGFVRRAVLLAWAGDRLRRVSPAARREAEWMMSEVLGCGRAQLHAYPEAAVAPEAVERVRAMVARRLRREPLQYVLGHTDFFGLRLRVTPAVLIPRPETEEVVEAALNGLDGVQAPRVLDVGTGSGCIALAVRARRPDAVVTGCDLSAEALAVARANAVRLDLDVAFVRADVLDPACIQRLPEALDLLVSNPPYVPDAERSTLAPEVREHEPHAALFTGPDPLRFYRALADRAERLLAPDGHLVAEVHADYGREVAGLLEAHGFAAVRLQRDLAGRDRIVEARHGGP